MISGIGVFAVLPKQITNNMLNKNRSKVQQTPNICPCIHHLSICHLILSFCHLSLSIHHLNLGDCTLSFGIYLTNMYTSSLSVRNNFAYTAEQFFITNKKKKTCHCLGEESK